MPFLIGTPAPLYIYLINNQYIGFQFLTTIISKILGKRKACRQFAWVILDETKVKPEKLYVGD